MTKAKDGYLGNPNLKPVGVQQQFTPEQVTEYIKCTNDPSYFVKRYVKIVSVDKGLIPFEMYDYQEKLIKILHENRFVIGKLPRQTGKTTTVGSYLLHYVLFNQNVNVAILANKQSTAIEILSRIKMAFEYLPKWLQQGVIEWNKGSVVLENGARIIASATSSSAIRGGSYNCIAGKSKITVKDIVNGKIFNTTIEELYANSSKISANHKYKYGNDRKQIQEVVLFPYGEWAKSCYGRIDLYGKSPHNTTFAWRDERSNQSCSTDSYGAHTSASTFAKISVGGRTEKDDLCTSYDDKSWILQNHPFRRNKKENWCISQRENEFARSTKENKHSKYGTFIRSYSSERVWGKDIQNTYGEKEIKGTFGQNQQESRKNQKDRRKTSRNETFARSESTNERSSKSTNSTKRWSLEQGDEDGRWEVLTHTGFKKFYGISKAPNKKTIKVIFDNNNELICTPDHKIFSSRRGFVSASSLHIGEQVNCDSYRVGVIRICDSGDTDVYDLLEVEDHNSFYANGILVKNCILLDEFAHIPTSIAEEFFTSVYPTITSGQSTKMFIISTPNGLNMFYYYWKGAINNQNGYIPFEVHWSQVPTFPGGPLRGEKWKQEMISRTSEKQFDQEMECDFLGSSNTLISSDRLHTLVYSKPMLRTKDGMSIYQEPIRKNEEIAKSQDHLYFLTADVSEGQGKDFTAITVIDVTEFPYRVVAVYRNNTVSPLLFASVVKTIARKYNNAYVLIEINGIGSEVANVLHTDLEYENMVKTAMMGRKGQIITEGFGPAKKVQLGVKTSVLTKKVGCQVLKNMIEEDKLIVEDADIISEFTTFISKKQSFEAEDGHNDDLVMCLVIFAWATRQQYFKNLTDMDVRLAMYQDDIDQVEDNMLPFGYYSDGMVDIEDIEEDSKWSTNGDNWLIFDKVNIKTPWDDMKRSKR